MKKIIIALTLGLLIGSATTALAATSDTVQAVFNKFSFKVNGQTAEVKTTPLEVNGTSYLPVRELAGLLGYSVDYDGATNTILLDLPKTEPTATKPIEKDGVNVEATVINPTEWISIYDLAETQALIVGQQDKSNGHLLSVYRDNKVFFVIDTLQLKEGDILSDSGVRITKIKGVMSINKADLKTIGLD